MKFAHCGQPLDFACLTAVCRALETKCKAILARWRPRHRMYYEFLPPNQRRFMREKCEAPTSWHWRFICSIMCLCGRLAWDAREYCECHKVCSLCEREVPISLLVRVDLCEIGVAPWSVAGTLRFCRFGCVPTQCVNPDC